jgi:hypothetical protein
MIFTLTARDLVNMVGRAHINLLIEGAHVYQPLTLVHAIQALGGVGTLLLFVHHTKVRLLSLPMVRETSRLMH